MGWQAVAILETDQLDHVTQAARNAYVADEDDSVLSWLYDEFRVTGRPTERFQVAFALSDPPSPDLYRRFEHGAMTALICTPWMVTN